MNSLLKITALKRLLKENKIDKTEALDSLSDIIQNNKVKEFDVCIDELKKLKGFKEHKLYLMSNLVTQNENSNDIMEFLSLRDNEMIKIKNIGYKLL